jgi:hypothetical protein
MPVEEDLYHALTAYTLQLRDPGFLHQHVVDAFAAQSADETSKTIGVAFALIGLYLHVDKGFTGRQVQRVHMQLARRRRKWPRLELPGARGRLTVADVMAAPAGAERDAKIEEWCAAVWDSCSGCREQVVELLTTELNVS